MGTRTIEDGILEEAACVLDEFQATMGAAWQGKTKCLVGAGVTDGAPKCFGCNADPKDLGGGTTASV